MATIEHVVVEGFEEVVRGDDPATGLRAYVAVHSTRLGPALGGTRFRPYRSEADALTDVLRLARGMTYKAAVSGLGLGGGKAVIIGDPATIRTDALLSAYARLVDSLDGRYLTAEDVGTTQADMDLIRSTTPHVTGVSGALGGSGDPSPATALGVRHAMRAVAARRWGSPSLAGRRVVVSGIGKVGAALVAHLVDDGAEVVVADVDAAAVDRLVGSLGVGVVPPADAHRTPCDVFSPCALGAVLGAATIPELRCAAVVGSANNQLTGPDDGDRIGAAGVVYAPDYVVNAGGIINIAEELHPAGYDRHRAMAAVGRIEATTGDVLDTATREGITTVAAADRVAEARLAAATPADGGRPGVDVAGPADLGRAGPG